MSILWRAGVSERQEFKKVCLGQKHEENLRKMLFEGNSGEPYEYGCLTLLTRSSEKIVNEIVQNLIISPESVKIHGMHCYRFLFGMLWWIFFVDNRSKNIPEIYFFSKDGSWPIFIVTKHSEDFIKKLSKNLRIS